MCIYTAIHTYKINSFHNFVVLTSYNDSVVFIFLPHAYSPIHSAMPINHMIMLWQCFYLVVMRFHLNTKRWKTFKKFSYKTYTTFSHKHDHSVNLCVGPHKSPRIIEYSQSHGKWKIMVLAITFQNKNKQQLTFDVCCEQQCQLICLRRHYLWLFSILWYIFGCR